jgi:hypothetical protein
MEVTSAKYTLNVLGQNGGIKATIDGVVCHVPINTANTHYQAIQEWVLAGNTIEEAD